VKGPTRRRWTRLASPITRRVRRVAGRYYARSRGVREVVAATRWPALRKELPDIAHLVRLAETAWGPVQRDEALFLHALVRVLRPSTVVEIGFLHGHSAFNFLRALDADARLYSFDIDPAAESVARERFRRDSRFVFRRRSQTDLTGEDMDGRQPDLVFLDASHDFELNQATFSRLLPLMSPNAILAVHDTGTIPRRLVEPDRIPDALAVVGDWWRANPDVGWIGDEREVEPGERAFVNWVLENHPDFSQIHLHSTRTFRYGLTLLQRSTALPRP
jgi:predicted O-methyltransferase YrrM